ncbi:MAG: tetratricopeptide repeat protein, partial [Treponema sp.]|nr:tetratricopeptide repeat protein [Treponema sp.]
MKKGSYVPVICFFLFLLTGSAAFAQTRGPASNTQAVSHLQAGVNLYRESRWPEAVIELRQAQAAAVNAEQRAEALYWISLAELSAQEYEAAVRDMDELVRISPSGQRRAEIPYHKGRALYYLGRYDEAVVLLKDYADHVGEGADSRKSAALYWIGECLFSMGQLDQARSLFTLITEQYPQSAKYEASSYRLALINQKKI